MQQAVIDLSEGLALDAATIDGFRHLVDDVNHFVGHCEVLPLLLVVLLAQGLLQVIKP